MSDQNMSRVKNKQNNQNKNKKKTKKNKKKKTSWFKRIFLTLIGLFLFAIVSGGGLFAYYASSAPELTEDDLLGSFSSELLDAEGNVFYTLGGETRDYAQADEYPQVMKDAMTAIEDQNFYDHFGIDPIGIGRAAFGYISNLGEISGGGSTITQQLVKLSVFSTTRADQTLERKAQEAWLAIQLEQRLSKEQILTLYMNKIHMAKDVYGIATASEAYYGKPVSELSLNEAALFAGMAQAPNRYDPYTNPEAAEERRNIVLNVMRDNGDITAEEAETAKNIPIQEGLVEYSVADENGQVIDSYLVEVLAEVEEKTGLDPSTAGLTIQTNMDMEAQQIAYDVVNSEDYVNFPDDELQTAVSLIDVNTGQIKAMVGGRKKDGQLLRNRATNNDRQTGSTVKPLTTYGPAIEFEQFSTYHQVVDEEWTYPDGTPLRNYDGRYLGQISMRQALVDSRNVPTARIFNEELETTQVSEFLTNIGIDPTTLSPTETILPYNAISGYVSPLQVAASYSAFANGGNYTEPYTVSKVITQDGQEIDMIPETNQAMSDYTAYMITDMLKDVADNYNSVVGIPGVPQAGKTGTTNYSEEQHQEYNIPSNGVPDSWYVGYTSNYSLSVWSGYDKRNENWLSNENGTRQLPRQIYQAVMSRVSEGLENTDWTKPSSVSEVSVEEGSSPAQLPGPNTPSEDIVTELFVTGTEPNEVSTAFGEELTAPTGLSAEYNADTNEVSISWDAYSLANPEEEIAYLLSINGQQFTTTETNYTVTDPEPGTLGFSLAVQAYGNTGPGATATIDIPEPEQDTTEEDQSSEESDQPADEQDNNDENNDNNDNEEETSDQPAEDNTEDSTGEDEDTPENNEESEDDSSEEDQNSDQQNDSENDSE